MSENNDTKPSFQTDEERERENPSPLEGKRAAELFKVMSADDQDEILRLILSEGGFERLMRILRASDRPGSLDLLLDRICYYHFLPPVKE